MGLVNHERDGFFVKHNLPVVNEESILECRGCIVNISRTALEWICEKIVKDLPWGSRIMEYRGIHIREDGSLRVFFTHPELPVVKEGDDFPVFEEIE